jgi:ubiquinone/menaquinone biosynthesis C-methylase UbiE
MGKEQSDLHFRLMALTYRFRDLLLPRRRILEEAEITAGMRVLDFGCGPGSYVALAAELVGESGMVYALDAHPLALARVRRIRATMRLTNVETILSECETGLPDDAVDVVLLYDVLHDLSDKGKVLRELRRVLKPGGLLSFSDHHLDESAIMSHLSGDRSLRLLERGKHTYSFTPRDLDRCVYDVIGGSE